MWAGILSKGRSWDRGPLWRFSVLKIWVYVYEGRDSETKMERWSILICWQIKCVILHGSESNKISIVLKETSYRQKFNSTSIHIPIFEKPVDELDRMDHTCQLRAWSLLTSVVLIYHTWNDYMILKSLYPNWHVWSDQARKQVFQ